MILFALFLEIIYRFALGDMKLRYEKRKIIFKISGSFSQGDRHFGHLVRVRVMREWEWHSDA